jgi:hypothetical protein
MPEFQKIKMIFPQVQSYFKQKFKELENNTSNIKQFKTTKEL